MSAPSDRSHTPRNLFSLRPNNPKTSYFMYLSPNTTHETPPYISYFTSGLLPDALQGWMPSTRLFEARLESLFQRGNIVTRNARVGLPASTECQHRRGKAINSSLLSCLLIDYITPTEKQRSGIVAARTSTNYITYVQ